MEKKIIISTTVLITIFFLASPLVMAHSPLGTGDNESIGKATVIPDPTKSWALYSQLNSDGDAQYYTFNITTGQKIHLTMYKSMRSEDANFSPRLVVIGPDIAAQGEIPAQITIPLNSNAQLVSQTEPTPTYEPFSPGTFIGLADETLDNPAPGTYYLVVYEQSDTPTGGNYGIAVGERETYTIDEWVLIPFNLLAIYQWEGQSLGLILAPMIATLIVGISIVMWRFKKQCNLANPQAWLGAIAGLTFIGTGVTTFYQMLSAATHVAIGAEALITFIFAIVPLSIGLITFMISVKISDKSSLKKRIYYLVLGVAALFMWAGFIIGPILSIVASVMPTILQKRKNSTLP